MDYVPCILMGMCLLCGPGFGGSDQQTSESTGSTTGGRPMTIDEFLQMLINLLANRAGAPPTPAPSLIDHYRYDGSIGRRRAPNNLQQILQESSNHGKKSSSEESIDSSLLSWSAMPAIPNSSIDLSKYIFNHMMERAKVLRIQEFLDNERKKLQARRGRHRSDPFMSAI